MRRVVLVAGAIAALCAPSLAHATSPADPATQSRAGLTKNQRIALDALDAHQVALRRYAAFVAARATLRKNVRSRVKCALDRINTGGMYYPQFDALSNNLKSPVAISFQFTLEGSMYKAMPRKKGRYSARSVKGLYLAAASRARKRNPDLTGERIIRGLRAQADRIDTYRTFPNVQFCAVLDSWAANGFDTGRLDPLVDAYSVIALAIQAGDFDGRLDAAIEAMKTVPGIDPTDAGRFQKQLVADPLMAIYLPLVP